MALLRRLLGNAADAEDAWQDTWTAVWRALPRLRTERDPWPFIRQAAVRKCIDRVRVRRRTEAEPLPAEPAAPSAPERRGEPAAIDLGGLSVDERAAVALFFFEGCSVRDIATSLDVPEGTVKTWLYRARAKLRAQLGRSEGLP